MLTRLFRRPVVKSISISVWPLMRRMTFPARGISSSPRELPIRNVVIYDGVCNLCNSGIRFVLRRTNPKLKFCAAQTKNGAQVLDKIGISLDNVMKQFAYVDCKGQVYRASTAALRISKEMKWPWPIVSVFLVIPAILRDPVYDVVAKHRYRMFGRTKECQIPSNEIRDRFLGWLWRSLSS